MLGSSPFHPNMNLRQSLSIFTHRDGRFLGTVCQHSRVIQYVSVHDLYFSSYNFNISRFSRSGTCKGEVNVYRSKHGSNHSAFLSRNLVTHRHQCVINKVANESLRKICHYQQNVPQHYYVLDI